MIHGGLEETDDLKIKRLEAVLCRVQDAVVGNTYTCSPRFSESCHRQFPTAGGAEQIGSGVDGWMLRVVNVHRSRSLRPLRQGEEVRGLGHHTQPSTRQ